MFDLRLRRWSNNKQCLVNLSTFIIIIITDNIRYLIFILTSSQINNIDYFIDLATKVKYIDPLAHDLKVVEWGENLTLHLFLLSSHDNKKRSDF